MACSKLVRHACPQKAAGRGYARQVMIAILQAWLRRDFAERPTRAFVVKRRGYRMGRFAGRNARIFVCFCQSSDVRKAPPRPFLLDSATVETDEEANPIDINFFSPYAVVQVTDMLAQLIKHFCGGQQRQRRCADFHDSFSTV